MLWEGKRLGLIYKNASQMKNPKAIVEVYSDEKLTPEFLDNLKKEIVWRFDLDLDLKEFYEFARKDKLLKPIVKRFYGLRPMHYGSLYEYLMIGIMLQNMVVKRSVSMLQSLFEKYGVLLDYAGEKLWSYWEPKAMAAAGEAELRALKVGYRAKSLIKVSQQFVERKIDENALRKASKEEQEKTLIGLYGVGPQTLGYMMPDVFHRFDYMRHISPWEQKIYSRIFFNKELVPVKTMLKQFEKWGKWKALAVHYVWEDIWWKRRNESVPWLEELIKL